MSLNSFFQISVSVFSIVATIFIIIVFVWVVIIRIQIGKLVKKFEEIAAKAESATNQFKEFIERTVASLEKFKDSLLTFDFIKKAAEEIIKMVKSKKKE
ncbi:MAG: hypothetical protein NTW79_04245 [Candidatus Berkelbacteria bacterium]|nr:hypothetical protein [Candidatus Berkelbacteria bacterium]